MGAQDFWVASDESSSHAQITWAIEDGSYEIVVMNADGTAGVVSAADFGASLPTSTGLWLVVLGLGIASMVGGTALLIVGVRRARAS